MMKQNRVFITGIGMVTSHGIGKEQGFSALLEGKPCVIPIPDSFNDHYTFKSHFYVPFPCFDLSSFGIHSRYIKMMQDEDQIAVLCAYLALKDAGISIEPHNTHFRINDYADTGVLIGTGFSGLQTAFNSYCAHAYSEKTALKYNRLVIPMTMPNSVAAWVSIFFGIQGSSITINASCASGTVALGRAYRLIQSGHYKAILAGGVECLKESTGAIMRGFDVLGTLTKSGDGAPLPFSEQRSGFLFSEGGGSLLLLEECDHALQRGAPVYAEIVDFRENSDAFGIVQINPDALQIIKLLGNLKANRQIDYINTHGTATLTNDSTEALAINKVFGKKETQPLVNATKGILGHTIGASGAIEAAVTALSIKKNRIHGSGVPDSLDINLVPHSIEREITYALSVSYGFGGHNAGLLFKRHKMNE